MRSLSVDPVRERFKREPQVLDLTRAELKIWIRPPGRTSSTHPTVRHLLQAASQGTYFSFSSPTSLTTQSYVTHYLVLLHSLPSLSLLTTQSYFTQYLVLLYSLPSLTLLTNQSYFTHYLVLLYLLPSLTSLSTQSYFTHYLVLLHSLPSLPVFTTWILDGTGHQQLHSPDQGDEGSHS